MQKIPLEAEVSFWFAETIKHPSFINTLNEYQKSKLLEYAEERIHSALEFAIRFFENTTEANYPEGWPVERQLEYVVNQNCRSNFTPIRKVLNSLGFDWNYEESLHPLKKAQPEKKPAPPKKLIQIAPSAIPSLFECLKEYFAQEEHPKLEALLNGQPIEGKVHFLKNQNQLADVFFKLKEKNLLFNTIEEASVWLATFYKYKTKGTFEDCKQSSIADVFSKEEKRPKEHKAICTKIGQ